MEFKPEITIFGLKMMVKSGLQFILMDRKEVFSNTVTKMTFFSQGGISKKCFVVYTDMINET